MVDYDKFETWGDSFREIIVNMVGREVVDRLSSLNLESMDDAGRYVASFSDVVSISRAIQGWLLEHDFCVFHGTRLLPDEILSVQREGLRPLVAADREGRLRKILERHSNWNSVKGELCEILADLGPKEDRGQREGQVHFSLSRSGLVSEFNHYLTYGSEFDQCVVERLFDDESGLALLNSESVPILVHVCFSGEELIQGAHPDISYSDGMGRGEIPGLAQTFLNTWARKAAQPNVDIAALQTDCCMMQRVATGPERILNVEKLGDLVAC